MADEVGSQPTARSGGAGLGDTTATFTAADDGALGGVTGGDDGEGQVPGDFDDGDDEAPTADQREAVTKEMTNMLATHLQELKHKYVDHCTQGLRADSELFNSYLHTDPAARVQQKSAAAAAAAGGGGATAAPGAAGAPGAPGRGRALAERKKLEGKHGTVWTYSRLIAKRRADDAAAASRESDKGRGGNGNHKESAQANDSATLLRQFEELWNSPRRMGRRASQVADPANASHSAGIKAFHKQQRVTKLRGALHAQDAKLMGRLVDNVHFNAEDPAGPPFRIDCSLVLRLVAETMHNPYNEAHFRHFLVTPLSCSILEDLFWYVHCVCFQPDTTARDQAVLLQRVSVSYVRMLRLITSNKDYFFEAFPYAIAYGVRLSFHHFVPGSRARFTSAWRLQVYITVVRILCGMDVCAVTVQRMVETYFPFEGPSPETAVRDRATKATRLRRRQPARPIMKARGNVSDLQPLPGPAWEERVAALKALPATLALPAELLPGVKGAGDTGKSASATASVAGESRSGSLRIQRSSTAPSELGTSAVGADNNSEASHESSRSEESAPITGFPQGRQMRLPFGASNVSGLVRHFLRHPSSTAGRQEVTFKRTTPVPWVRVGGVDTFHAMPPNSTAAAIKAGQDTNKDMYERARKDKNRKLMGTLKGIKTRKNVVLQGGVSAVSKFCLDLAHERQERLLARRKERLVRSRSRRGSSGGSKGSKGHGKQRRRRGSGRSGGGRGRRGSAHSSGSGSDAGSGADSDAEREQTKPALSPRKKRVQLALAGIPSPSPLTTASALPALTAPSALLADHGLLRTKSRVELAATSNSARGGHGGAPSVSHGSSMRNLHSRGGATVASGH